VAKMTLLDMTQNILSAMDSDPASSIDETVEAVQVAELVKESFFYLMSQRDWPFLFALGELVALGNVAKPTTMRMPTTWNKIKWIKYNKKEIEWVDPHAFQDILDQRVEQADVIDAAGFVINRDPIYWTSYDDDYIVFDGYDKVAESSLQASKTTTYGAVQAAWTHVDTFVPSIPEKFFPTLLAEAKSQAFVNLKQQSNNREERKAQSGKVVMRNEVWKNENGEAKFNRKVNYGRR